MSFSKLLKIKKSMQWTALVLEAVGKAKKYQTTNNIRCCKRKFSSIVRRCSFTLALNGEKCGVGE